jgi:hypothetical protein
MVLGGIPVIAILVVVSVWVGDPWSSYLPWIGRGALIVGCFFLLMALKASRVKESLAAVFAVIYAGALGVVYLLLGALAMWL